MPATRPPITLELEPDDLLCALDVCSRFRSTDESRPILESVHVRPSPGRKLLEWTATDSYHLVRVTTPARAMTRLPASGVMIRLHVADVRRLVRAVDRHRAGDDPGIAVTVSAEPGTAFGLSKAGKWTGGGVFATATGPTAEHVDMIATGDRVAPTVDGDGREYGYPDVDALLESAQVPDTVAADAVIAMSGRLLADIGTAADVFARHVNPYKGSQPGPGYALRLTGAGDPLKPLKFEVPAVEPDGPRFLAILMPVRAQ